MTFKDIFLRAVAALGLIAVLLLGAWGIIQIAFRMPAVFSAAGDTLSSLFASNETGRETGAGSAVVPASGTGAQSAGSSNNTPASSGVAVVTKPASSVSKTTSLYGFGDLSVRVLSTGAIDRFSGAYTPNVSARAGTRAGVQFVIENAGTNVIPAGWTFTATLPGSPAYLYTSAAQPAVYPGSGITYTIGFDVPANYASGAYPYYTNYTTANPYYTLTNPYSFDPYAGSYTYDGTYNYYHPGYAYPYNYQYGYNYQYPYDTRPTIACTVTITADPQGRVTEYNRANNTAQTTCLISY